MSGNDKDKNKIVVNPRELAKRSAESRGWYSRYAADFKKRTGRTLPFADKTIEIEKKFATLGDAMLKENFKQIDASVKELREKFGLKEQEFQSVLAAFKADAFAAVSKTAGAVKSAFKKEEDPKPKPSVSIGAPINPKKADVSSVTNWRQEPEKKDMPVKPSREGMPTHHHKAADLGRAAAKAAAAKAAAAKASGKQPPPVPTRENPRKR